MPKLNFRKLFSSNVPLIISFSDASDTACGSVISRDTHRTAAHKATITPTGIGTQLIVVLVQHGIN